MCGCIPIYPGHEHRLHIWRKKPLYCVSMFDVLVYVYEHFWRGDSCPELPQLGRKLSAAGFESDDIEQALRTTLRKFEHQSGLSARLQMHGHGVALPSDVQLQVLHVVQEALSNVVRHAKARRVEFGILEMGGQVMTLWMGQDGVDYAFQGDYAAMWDTTMEALAEGTWLIANTEPGRYSHLSASMAIALALRWQGLSLRVPRPDLTASLGVPNACSASVAAAP